MTRKFAALMIAAGMLTGFSCGGGSNNADNSSNSPNNESNDPNSNDPNNDSNANNSAFLWSATLTGDDLEGDFAPPDEGLGGDGVAKAATRLLGGSNTEPEQQITITAADSAVYGETGEAEVSVLLAWGEPRVECVSNLADTTSPTGATITITELGPAKGTFTADLDCYLSSDTSTTVEATATGSFDIIGL